MKSILESRKTKRAWPLDSYSCNSFNYFIHFSKCRYRQSNNTTCPNRMDLGPIRYFDYYYHSHPGSIRLKLFLDTTGIKLSYRHCLIATFYSLSLNLVLPARGGDFAKLALLKKDFPNLSFWTLISTTLLEEALIY